MFILVEKQSPDKKWYIFGLYSSKTLANEAMDEYNSYSFSKSNFRTRVMQINKHVGE